MSHSTAAVLQEILMEDDFGVNPTAIPAVDWPVFLGFLPDGPNVRDNVIAVYDTRGRKDGRDLGSGHVTEHPGFMITVRAQVYQDGWQKAYCIAKHFDKLGYRLVGVGDDVCQVNTISRTMPVLPMGAEPGTKRRWLFSINGVAGIGPMIYAPASFFQTVDSFHYFVNTQIAADAWG